MKPTPAHAKTCIVSAARVAADISPKKIARVGAITILKVWVFNLSIFMRTVCSYRHNVLDHELIIITSSAQLIMVVLKTPSAEFTICVVKHEACASLDHVEFRQDLCPRVQLGYLGTQVHCSELPALHF